MDVLLSALAQAQFKQGGGTGGVFPLIPTSYTALTHFLALGKSLHFSPELIFIVCKSLLNSVRFLGGFFVFFVLFFLSHF